MTELTTLQCQLQQAEDKVAELKKQIQEAGVPSCINSGDLFQIGEYIYMVSSFSSNINGMTIIETANRSIYVNSGKFSSIVGVMTAESLAELRKILVTKGAKFVGRFHEQFVRKDV